MRRLLGLLLALALLLPALPAGAYSYYPPGPDGMIGLARPTMGQQILLGTGESILGASAWIDGQPVLATWTEEGLIQFQPSGSLTAGEHTARLQVRVDTGIPGLIYQPHDTTWRFTVDGGALTALPSPGREAQRAQARLNQLRRQVGLPLVALSESLSSAARSHAAYLVRNPQQYEVGAHNEVTGRLGFTGRTPSERTGYWGWLEGTGEVIAQDARAEDAVDLWMATLYHRLPLIDPDTSQIGYGWAGSGQGGYNVLVAGMRGGEAKAIAWPSPGMQNVDPEWDGLEVPDPLALYDLTGPVGYPISLTWGGEVYDLRLTAASLSGPAGEVPLLRYDPSIDSNLQDSVAVIPRDPLLPSTTYVVNLSGLIDQGEGMREFRESWSFKTAPSASPAIDGYARRGSQVTLTGRSFAPGIKLFLGGVAVSVKRISATELQFSLPAGVGGTPVDLLLVNPDGREGRWMELAFDVATPGTSPLQPIRLEVDGAALPEGALIDGSGALFLPESALRTLGGQSTQLEGLYRSDWEWPGRTGEYTRASLKASVGDSAFALAAPPFWYQGQLWLEARFVEALTGAPLVATAGRVMLGAQAPTPQVTGNFTDTKGHWAEEQIRTLAQQGIISGYPDGSFRPDTGLSRAAFIKLLAQAMGLKLAPGETGPYGDAVGHWVSELGYLGAARSAGILPDWRGALEPDRLISRSEIAVMLTRALRLEVEAQRRAASWDGSLPWLISGRPFQDAGTWAQPGHVAMAIESGIIAGYAESGGRFSFRPEREATRAEAAVMVARFLAKSR